MGEVLGHLGSGTHRKIDLAEAGDIVAITGLRELNISDTVCDYTKTLKRSRHSPLMSRPFLCSSALTPRHYAVKKGRFVTLVGILDRLNEELVHNVALRVPTKKPKTPNHHVLVVANCAVYL
ncbi:hypothetical protein ACNKHN_22260 [Shigella flexneri]